MATFPALIRADLVTACRDATVAAKAGFITADWSSTTIPHVFEGTQGYIGGRNRGRLPFLEVACADLGYEARAVDGGVTETNCVIRCHVGARDQSVADDLATAILIACLVKIRDITSTTYLYDGGQNLTAIEAGPWGLQKDLRITVRHTYSSSNYGST